MVARSSLKASTLLLRLSLAPTASEAHERATDAVVGLGDKHLASARQPEAWVAVADRLCIRSHKAHGVLRMSLWGWRPTCCVPLARLAPLRASRHVAARPHPHVLAHLPLALAERPRIRPPSAAVKRRAWRAIRGHEREESAHTIRGCRHTTNALRGRFCAGPAARPRQPCGRTPRFSAGVYASP
jgi:hypothetical protein